MPRRGCQHGVQQPLFCQDVEHSGTACPGLQHLKSHDGMSNSVLPKALVRPDSQEPDGGQARAKHVMSLTCW
jgi:hypothetical protein